MTIGRWACAFLQVCRCLRWMRRAPIVQVSAVVRKKFLGVRSHRRHHRRGKFRQYTLGRHISS